MTNRPRPETLPATWTQPGATIVSAWILQPAGFVSETKKIDNFIAPGAAVFASAEEARLFAAASEGYEDRQPFEVWLPGTWERCTTLKRSTAYTAFHIWHRAHGARKALTCGLCRRFELSTLLPNPALLVEALIVNPETGSPAGWLLH